MPKRFTQEQFIKLANKVHNFSYDYSLSNYINANIKVKIICKQHGEFLQKPSMHLRYHGCAKCAGVQKLTTKEFIEKSKIIHNDKYDYSLVNYINYKKKLL